MRKCNLTNLDALFAAMADVANLYLPVDDDGGASFKAWEPGCVWSKKLNTTRSPKSFFFPHTEDLMAFKTEGKNIEIIDIRKESEDFIVFGVRPCDMKAFDVLDRVFLNDVEDSYYATRRQHGLLVSVACSRPSEACFCTAFGIDPTAPKADIAAWRTDDALYLDAQTEKGQALLAKLESLTETCDDTAVKAQQENTKKVLAKLPLAKLSTDKFGAGKTKELFDRPEWASLSESCLGCGTCTFVCPTCQCYDIRDFNSGRGVVRYRCWDSCMYSDFTKMSAGQPRLTQKERFRQRFMHKLVYYPENNNGLYSCVGCGRCVAKCPISMNIAKVMKTLGGNAND